MSKHPKFEVTDSGEVRLNFGEYGGTIDVAAFSLDGKRLLTVRAVGTAQIWNMETQQLVGEIKPVSRLDGTDAGPTTSPFQTFIESAALNKDGSLALLGLNDGTAGVFSCETGERLSTIREPRPEHDEQSDGWELIRSVCFSADDSYLALGHFGRTISVWKDHGNDCVMHLKPAASDRFVTQGAWGRDTLVSSVAISPDNRFVFAGSADGTACIWDMETEEVVLDAVDYAANIVDLSVASDCIQWATSDGNVWRSEAGNEPTKILATGQNWWSAKFSPTGSELLVRVGPSQIVRWSIDGQCEELADLEEQGFWLSSDLEPFAFGSDDKLFCHLTTIDSLKIQGHGAHAEMTRRGKFDYLFVSPQHDLLVAPSGEDNLKVWSLRTAQEISVIPRTRSEYVMALSNDGTLLACGGSGSPIDVYRISDGAVRAQLSGHEHQVHALAFGPTGDWLVSASLDRSVRKWELHRPHDKMESQRIVDKQLDFHYIHVLSDGRVLVFFRDRVEVWAELEECLVKIPASVNYRARFAVTPDEQYLLLTNGNTVEKWNLVNGELADHILPPIEFPFHVPSAELSAQIQARAGSRLWRHAGQHFIHQGDGPRGWVTPLDLSADGQLMTIPCAKGAALVTVEHEPKLVSRLPFDGRLRAAWMTRRSASLVNSDGQLFTWHAGNDGATV